MILTLEVERNTHFRSVEALIRAEIRAYFSRFESVRPFVKCMITGKVERRTGALYASLNSAAVEKMGINHVINKIAIIRPLIETTISSMKRISLRGCEARNLICIEWFLIFLRVIRLKGSFDFVGMK